MHIAFSRFCGPLDIIAHVGDREETDMMKEEGYPGEQNNWNYLPSRKRVFYNHIPAFRIREMLAEQSKYMWDDYFKFCFERNPWDKVISQYYFHHQRSQYAKRDLHQFIMHGTLPRFSDWRLYTEESKKDNTVIVDHVGRYDKMQDEFEFIRDKLKLPKPIQMPKKRLKGWTRKDYRNYQDVLTNEERNRVAKVFQKEIKLLGFKYD
jgi:hypothetical protein